MSDCNALSAERPWGAWFVLDEAPGYKVKRIEVQPGHRLSYQTHTHRAEHWVVVRGTATFVIDGVTSTAGPGEHIDVEQGTPHRICNDGDEPVAIIEVQRGEYTGEDDIIRLEDDYQRADHP